jgi:hypothetical protein
LDAVPIPNTSPNIGGWYQQLDRKLGGILPGGGTPIQPEVLNRLPGPVNLGYRYATGTGNKNLELSQQFMRGAVEEALKRGPMRPGEVRAVNPYSTDYPTPGIDTIPTALGAPTLGDTNPSAAPYRYTLGRYNVYDEGDRYVVRDRFDLENELEPKSLTQPGRQVAEGVVRTLVGVIDPTEFLRAYLNFRQNPPAGYDIEFSVPKSYGTNVGP